MATAKKKAPAKQAPAKKASAKKPKGLDSDGNPINLSSNSSRNKEANRAFDALRSGNKQSYKVAGRNISDFARNQPSLQSGSMARKPIALGGSGPSRGSGGNMGGRGNIGGGLRKQGK